MDTTTYLAACLAVALVVIAVLTAMLTRYRAHQDWCRVQAGRMQQALQRYSEWVSTQRLVAVFQGESPDAAAALDEACTIRMACFPELAGDMAELLAVHNRLVNFLATQQVLWLRNPEQWLESEHDKRFLALWRQHQYALHALLSRLEHAASVRLQPAARDQSTYA
jgi:hypothetical protein